VTKRLLIVAAEFPPVKGIGRLRPLKFCQHLASLGWETAVLTPVAGDIQPVDQATLLEIPKTTRIYRAPIPKPKERLAQRLKALLRWGDGRGDTGASTTGDRGGAKHSDQGLRSIAGDLMRWADAFTRRNLLIPDDIILWYGPAVQAGVGAVNEFHPDVILATAPHFTNLLVGARLSKVTGVPWIADYRDLWTGDVLRAWVPPWRQKVEQAIERRILRSASAVITVSAPKSEILRGRVPNADACPVVTLTNGYDVEEFESVVPEQGDPRRYRVIYAGRLFKNRRGYEFVEAVGRLVRDDPSYRHRLRVEYYGDVAPEIAGRMSEVIAEYGIREVVEFFPDVPYARSKAIQKGADALLLIVDGGETTSGVIPGKLFEYVAANRPIICIAAPGATTEIIERGRLGVVVEPGDVAGLEAAVKKFIDEGNSGFQPDKSYLEQFERSRIVGRLAEVLDVVRRPTSWGKE
jgi:glycosyltransferase involved in cell wall biosynthesis